MKYDFFCAHEKKVLHEMFQNEKVIFSFWKVSRQWKTSKIGVFAFYLSVYLLFYLAVYIAVKPIFWVIYGFSRSKIELKQKKTNKQFKPVLLFFSFTWKSPRKNWIFVCMMILLCCETKQCELAEQLFSVQMFKSTWAEWNIKNCK